MPGCEAKLREPVVARLLANDESPLQNNPTGGLFHVVKIGINFDRFDRFGLRFSGIEQPTDKDSCLIIMKTNKQSLSLAVRGDMSF